MLAPPQANDARQPWWVEYAVSFFPVILIVFLLRSFLVEPFKIPSGSMIPTLLVGDFILVNKFTYGIRLPVINKKIIEVHDPERGDVMVFRYPEDPSLDYIKRVVGLPGDRVEYRNKRLTINGAAGADATQSTITCPRSACSSRRPYVGEARRGRARDPAGGRRALVVGAGARIPVPANCHYNTGGLSVHGSAGPLFRDG